MSNTFKLYGMPVPPPEREKTVTTSRALFPDSVPRVAVAHFLNLTILGPGRKWAFLSVGKNASSSVLRFLYELEFGHPLTASLTSRTDINPSSILHQLAEHGVFARALQRGMTAQELQTAEIPRMMVCRDPMDRAVSAFRYFCRSNQTGATWFARERLRIDASVGFDWTTMPDTVEGFRRFLRFVELEIDTVGEYRINGHWRPQRAFSHPEIYRPTLVGRVEALPEFFRAAADHLGADRMPPLPNDNRQTPPPDDLASDGPARILVQRLYAQDYEEFGY